MTDSRRMTLEAAILIAAAILCALIANGMASRERKLALVGDYPSAIVVPPRADAGALEPTPVEPPSQMLEQPEAATTPPEATENPEGESPQPSTPAEPSPSSTTAPSGETAAAPPEPSRRELILSRFAPAPDAPWVEISGADAVWLHEQGVLFLDARRTRTYEEGHITGARNFAVWESDVDQKVATLSTEVTDQEMPIVVYCSGGDCEDSHLLSQKLWGLFFNNVLVYKDGFPDWQKRSRPIRRGSNP